MYTHWVTYEKKHSLFGWVQDGFRTSVDMVQRYEKGMRKRKDIRNLQIVPIAHINEKS